MSSLSHFRSADGSGWGSLVEEFCELIICRTEEAKEESVMARNEKKIVDIVNNRKRIARDWQGVRESDRLRRPFRSLFIFHRASRCACFRNRFKSKISSRNCRKKSS